MTDHTDLIRRLQAGAQFCRTVAPLCLRQGKSEWAEGFKLLDEDLREAAAAIAREREPEVCLCAAIRLDDGRIIRGHRHDDCIQTALKWKKAGQEIGQALSKNQGFLTTRGRFVDRREGAALQSAAGIPSAQTGQPLCDGVALFSEDLY